MVATAFVVSACSLIDSRYVPRQQRLREQTIYFKYGCWNWIKIANPSFSAPFGGIALWTTVEQDRPHGVKGHFIA
jgi:hypothetical protein